MKFGLKMHDRFKQNLILIKELDLRGMSYWKLGLSFPQNWLLITDNLMW